MYKKVNDEKMNNLIQKYIELTTEHGELMQNGDDKNGNMVHSKIGRIVLEIQQSDKETKIEYYKLLDHSNTSVKCWTAIELIGTKENKSIDVLNNLSKEKGLISLTASSLIDMWKKGMINKVDWNKAST